MARARKVLITNYSYKNALAAVRDIGSRGIRVHTCGPRTRNKVASLSTYCSGYFNYTSPTSNINKFYNDIKKILSIKEYEMIMPIGVDTTIPISIHKENLQNYTKVPVADYEILNKAHDKYETIKIAKSLGVPVPKTSIISGDSFENTLEYPLVIKARKGASGFGTRYVTSEEDFKKVVQEFNEKKSDNIHDFERPMVQEYIPGDLMDVCVLFNCGRPRAALAQRRVLTYPPSGGDVRR